MLARVLVLQEPPSNCSPVGRAGAVGDLEEGEAAEERTKELV